MSGPTFVEMFAADSNAAVRHKAVAALARLPAVTTAPAQPSHTRHGTIPTAIRRVAQAVAGGGALHVGRRTARDVRRAARVWL
jgi:hypothetical protein